MQNAMPTSAATPALKPFGRLRNLLWPIYRHELKKLIPMFLLFFLISFVYNVLRNMKGALFKTSLIGSPVAELMPFLKVGAVLPGALFFTYIFTVLISRFSREKVFYIIISGFMIYFAVFLFVLYPNNAALRLDGLADFLQQHVFFAAGFKGVVAAIRHWNLTLFYVSCEMWSVVVLTMLFWGFANEVTKVDEAKRFYAIFALGANSSGIFSGEFGQRIGDVSWLPVPELYQQHAWIFLQIGTVLLLGGVIISIFYWLNKKVFNLEAKASVEAYVKPKKLSLGECLHYVRKSKYLMYMVVIVVGYNIVYNLSDTIWTNKIETMYGNGKDMNAYMNNITSITGYIAVILALLLSGNVIRTFGWTVTALITPLVWLVTGIGFYSGMVFDNTILMDILSVITSNPANLVLLLGSIQMSLGRACKYTVFDEAKEIAFIPLPKENQRKGKAVVDGLASRFGKSGGSFISIMLLALCGSIANVVPYVSVIVIFVMLAWLYATVKMGRIIDKSITEGLSLTDDEQVTEVAPARTEQTATA